MMTRRFHSQERLPPALPKCIYRTKVCGYCRRRRQIFEWFLVSFNSDTHFFVECVCDTLVMPACLSWVGIWRMHAHKRVCTREKLIIMLLPTMNGINNKITFCNLFQFKYCACRRCVVGFSMQLQASAGPFQCGFLRLAALHWPQYCGPHI